MVSCKWHAGLELHMFMAATHVSGAASACMHSPVLHGLQPGSGLRPGG